jgi:hypothetical protein
VIDGDIFYRGSSELIATSFDSKQITFEDQEENRKYIFSLDNKGRWIASLNNGGATVEYQLSRTTPLDDMLKMKIDSITVDTQLDTLEQ